MRARRPRALLAAARLLPPLAILACGGSAAPPPEATPTPLTYAQKLLGGLEVTAVEKTRQDMLAVRTAVVAWETENGTLPALADLDALAALLVPNYIRVLPRADAWGRPLLFSSSGDGWRLRAPGADAAPESDDDVVLSDRDWEQLPAGYRPPTL